jgi:hypothetical protein
MVTCGETNQCNELILLVTPDCWLILAKAVPRGVCVLDLIQLLVPIPLLKVAHPVAGGEVFNAIAAFSKPSGNWAYPNKVKKDMKKSNSFFIILISI